MVVNNLTQVSPYGEGPLHGTSLSPLKESRGLTYLQAVFGSPLATWSLNGVFYQILCLYLFVLRVAIYLGEKGRVIWWISTD